MTEPFRPRHKLLYTTLVALLLVSGLIVYTVVVAYFVPSWRGWDALWYHEPIVGFAIQNHGFSPIHSQDYGLRKIDGYPRLCELLNLWFVLMGGRRFIDIPNSLIAPLFISSVFLFVRKYEKNITSSLTWSLALFLMPCILEQLQSTYVDVHAAFFLIVAACFSVRAPLRVQDAVLGTLSVVLAIGSKHMALAPSMAILLVILCRTVLYGFRDRPRQTVAAVAGMSLATLAVLFALYLRNFFLYGEPFWPEARLEIIDGGIRILNPLREAVLAPKQQIADLLSIPFSWSRGHYGAVFGFGFGVAWIVIPTGTIAFVLAFGDLARLAFLRSARRSLGLTSRVTPPVLLGGLCLIALATSPALWGARYQIFAVVLFAAAAAWMSARYRLTVWGLVAPNIVLFAGLVSLFWNPTWPFPTPAELAKIAAYPYPEREVVNAREFSDRVDLHASPIPKDVGLARERELTAGKVIAIGDHYGTFSATFWNNDFSNRVVYLPDGADFLERANAVDATWLAAERGSRLFADLKRSDSWEEVGRLTNELNGVAFRRRPAHQL